MSVRLTQLGRLALAGGTSSLRLTQLGRMTVVGFSTGLRLSQLARLVIADVVPCVTFNAQLWRIERRDGTVFAFTSHDEEMSFRGETYTPCRSLAAGASELAAILGQVGNLELAGMIDDEAIAEADIQAGLFDGAALEVWQVPWDFAAGEVPRRLSAGTLGTQSHGVAGFRFEALTPGAVLQQQAVLQPYTRQCRWTFGDARCTVDVETLRETGAVTATAAMDAATRASRRTFRDSSRGEADDYWAWGTLTWTSGLNAGLSGEVKRFDAGTGEIVLWEPMRHAIAVGDAYSVIPGCDLLKSTCKDKFDNLINFGGFAEVPGADEILKTPNAKGGVS